MNDVAHISRHSKNGTL